MTPRLKGDGNSRAGTPTAVAPSGTSPITTAPAPMVTFAPNIAVPPVWDDAAADSRRGDDHHSCGDHRPVADRDVARDARRGCWTVTIRRPAD